MQKSEKGSAGDFGSLRVWRKAPESLAITRPHCALDHIPRVYSQSGNQVCSDNLVSDDSALSQKSGSRPTSASGRRLLHQAGLTFGSSDIGKGLQRAYNPSGGCIWLQNSKSYFFPYQELCC